MTYEHLFQPLQIGTCTISDRIARTAHATGAAGADLTADHEALARGGAGPPPSGCGCPSAAVTQEARRPGALP